MIWYFITWFLIGVVTMIYVTHSDLKMGVKLKVEDIKIVFFLIPLWPVLFIVYLITNNDPIIKDRTNEIKS